MNINPLMAIDFYKADHKRQYPEGTTEVYSNFTPRSNKLAKFSSFTENGSVVFFGLQYFIKNYLIDIWDENFFKMEKDEVIKVYKRRMDNSLGKDAIDISHIAELHDLGYLPIEIKALEEGSVVQMGIPLLTIKNTNPRFFWITNYLETVMSSYLWKPCTSATTAFEYKKIISFYAIKTGGSYEVTRIQAHDFSFRGMSCVEDAAISGAAHLTSFIGTDSVLSIDFLEYYYFANSEKDVIGVSVPATEHSVMCMGQKEKEIETFRRLINELYPMGIISIVSDTWDFWKVISEYTVILKSEIMRRKGKVVFRPDSGDPLKIICGDKSAEKGSNEYLGAVEILWNIFGGTTNSKGYKLLDPHVGLIYGDSITLERAENILESLKDNGFCSDNIVFGVGSFTYQYVTRDNFGFAMKATSGVVNGERREIFKDPITDDGTKKSAKGLLRVEYVNDKFVLYDQQTEVQEKGGLLKTKFKDGSVFNITNLSSIRKNIGEERMKFIWINSQEDESLADINSCII